MLRTYYTYRALAREWAGRLVGDHVGGAFSSRKDELSVELGAGSVIVFGARGPFRYLFRVDGTRRPGRNVTSVLTDAAGVKVVGVRVADRDRMLSIDLADGRELRYVLFGSRPNVYLVGGGAVLDAFKHSRRFSGSEAPVSRPAPVVTSDREFLERARRANSAAGAVRAGFALFDRLLAREALFRAGVRWDVTVEEALESAGSIFEAAKGLEGEAMDAESAVVYDTAGGDVAFSLTRLGHLENEPSSTFDDVDSAVSSACRMTLRRMRFEQEIGPARKVMGDRLRRAERRLREVVEHLEKPSGADRLERFGHLLMASGRGEETGLELIEVPDHFGAGEVVEVPLDASLSVVENAQRYYDRARRRRQSTEAALARVEQARADVEQVRHMALELEAVSDLDGLREFRRRHGTLRTAHPLQAGDARPFRRFSLGAGFEVWVGRNARENDVLTFSHAQKHDVWMHARGVGGSHVVLRMPSRGARPPAAVLEAAASVAAYFSKARGSELVPVMYTERKFVRKARGAGPGKVVVEREEVVIVPPRLPD